MKIHNFSRHQFSADQVSALKKAFPEAELGAAEDVFFGSSEDLAGHISGQIASLVAPWDMILEALARDLIAPGTVLISWRVDQAARKRGAAAFRGMRAFQYHPTGWSIFVELEIDPTVEVDFHTGEERPYGGP